MIVGDRQTLKASPVPSVAVPPAITWDSDNETVASVNDGVISALSEGQAIITASCLGKQAQVKVTVKALEETDAHVIYTLKTNYAGQNNELQINGAGSFTNEGLLVTQKDLMVKLDRFYALAERMARYEVTLSDDAVVNFHSSQQDFQAVVDVPSKTITIKSSPTLTVENVSFLKGGDYVVEVSHEYLRSTLRITDPSTGESAYVSASQDGAGGCGQGALQQSFNVGMQWDHYCFKLEAGVSMLVKRISVCSLKDDVNMIIYGDSITQPEGYYPSKDFSRAWTQQVIAKMGGNAMSSGRGGGTIDDVLNYIKNELPYIKTKYVMVTIGTNGGNTREKLSSLVDFIVSCGAIPILNNIPSNESGTQVEANALIESVRQSKGIKGCRFDCATSLAGDGKEVDKSLMFWEDYTGTYGWQVYHHPNALGGDKMFAQTLIDVPEIYE